MGYSGRIVRSCNCLSGWLSVMTSAAFSCLPQRFRRALPPPVRKHRATFQMELKALWQHRRRMTSGLEFQFSLWLAGDIQPLCPQGALLSHCFLWNHRSSQQPLGSAVPVTFVLPSEVLRSNHGAVTGEASVSLSLVIRHAFVKTDSWFRGWREPKENERKWWGPFTAGGLKNPPCFLKQN